MLPLDGVLGAAGSNERVWHIPALGARTGSLAVYLAFRQLGPGLGPWERSRHTRAGRRSGGSIMGQDLFSLAGQVALVTGGSRGLGLQMAHALGHRVFATAGSDEKCAACVRLGAERAINYRSEDFVDVVRAVTDGLDIGLLVFNAGANETRNPRFVETAEGALKRHGARIKAAADFLRDKNEYLESEVEKRTRENTPYALMDQREAAALFPVGHPYHHPTIGSMEDLDAASLQDVRDFFAAWYAPNNAVLTVVGDIDEAGIVAAVERFFGGIAANEALPNHPDLTLGAPLGGEVRKTVKITMSCDHRAIDGAVGARFLQTLRRMIENPLMLVY